MQGLSIRLFWNGIGEAHADPEWPNYLKIQQMLILSISNCEWHCPVKSAPESENMSTHVCIFSVYPINVYGVRKTAIATRRDVRT